MSQKKYKVYESIISKSYNAINVMRILNEEKEDLGVGGNIKDFIKNIFVSSKSRLQVNIPKIVFDILEYNKKINDVFYSIKQGRDSTRLPTGILSIKNLKNFKDDISSELNRDVNRISKRGFNVRARFIMNLAKSYFTWEKVMETGKEAHKKEYQLIKSKNLEGFEDAVEESSPIRKRIRDDIWDDKDNLREIFGLRNWNDADWYDGIHHALDYLIEKCKTLQKSLDNHKEEELSLHRKKSRDSQAYQDLEKSKQDLKRSDELESRIKAKDEKERLDKRQTQSDYDDEIMRGVR
jgi:hypothetical protein